MKKLILITLISCVLFFGVELSQSFAAAGSIEVKTTAKVPGAWCSGPDGDGVYTCRVGKWFTPVMLMVGQMIKYFTYIVALAAVLFIVINWVLYSMAWINDSLKTWAKDRITKTLIGLIILLLSWVILNAIAPWIYQL